MADPLSLSASLAGLIALADSIFRASFKYAKSAIHAKEEAANLATEAQDLAGVLHRLSLRASALELETKRPTIRLHHVISCRQLLLRVEKALARSTADFESPQSRHHLKRALKWPFSSTDTKEMLAEIARHRGTLSLALTVDSMEALSQCLTNQETLQAQMAAIASGVQETCEITAHIELNDRKRRVLDYFRRVDPQRSFSQCLSLRHPMTGLWLVDGEDFQQWLAVPRSKLWLTGIPGAGKTILAGAMIAEVLKLSSDSIGITFFFCEYKDQRSQDPLNILQTMAAQLALQNPAAYLLLEEYYKELQPLQGLGSNLSLWKMKDILGQMASCFEKVYMIIDGLDECGDNAAEVADTLADLIGHEESSAISLSILSRDEYQIREVLQGTFVRVEIAAQKEDVRLYVATEITSRIQQGKLRLRNMALKDEILHALVDENGGMFRWVACQLDYLCELPRDKDRRQALKSLPPTLNETYERILERVEKRDTSVRRIVQCCLEYITAADPPLTISELCEAVSVETDTEDLEGEDMIDEATILEHCSSLIRVRKSYPNDTRIIEFSHFSVAEYLQGPSIADSNLAKYHMSKSKGRKNLAISCLRFISLIQMRQPDSATAILDDILQKGRQHPFYPYASLFWLIYWNQSNDADSVLLVMKLFSPEKTEVFTAWALELCYFLLLPRGYFYRRALDERFERSVSGDVLENCRNTILEKNFTTLHLAAALGLSSICSQLIDNGANVNAVCSLGTPLHCAISPTWLILPDHRRHTFSRFGYDEQNRPWFARTGTGDFGLARTKSRDMGAAVSIFSSDISRAFHFYDKKRPEICQLFLRNGSKVVNSPQWPGRDDDDSRDEFEPGGLPLFAAAVVTSYRIRNLDIIVMLLKAGLTIYPDDLEMFRRTASLPWTPLRNDSYLSDSKLEGNNIRNDWDARVSEPERHIRNYGATVLAAIKDLCPISKAAADIYPYAFDIVASMSRHRRASERTKSLSCPAQTAPPTADPALMAIFAAQSDDAEELERLFNAGDLDINGRLNSKGQTILSIAAENGSTKAVQFLLRKGSDSTTRDFEGWLPLWHCISDAHVGVLAALLESDPSLGTCKDPEGNTIWHLVAQNGSDQLLQALIERSTDLRGDLTLMNYAGDAPLALAVMEENVEAAILMVDSCPDVVRFWSGKKPLLELAAKNGSLELAQKLVGTGFIDITATTADLSTPLHHINSRATVSCVRFLKSLFPDIKARNIHGARPLEAFIMNTTMESRLRGQAARINQILDELIPPDPSSSSSSTGATFWEQFCFGIAALIANMKAAGFRQWPRNSLSFDAVVKRLVDTGVTSAHEAKRKASAVLPFASAFDGTAIGIMDKIMVTSLTILLGVTNYLEEARSSHSLLRTLHQSIKRDSLRIVEALLDRGVDPRIRINGYNALDTACAHWSLANLEAFDMVLGCVEQSTINSLTTVNKARNRLGPIHLVGEPITRRRGDTKILGRQKLARLLNAGAEPNLCTGSNVPTLVFYMKRRNIDLSLYALELGVDPHCVDEDGYDAITHAVLRGHVKFISHLRDLEQQGCLGYTVQWNRRVDIVWDAKWRGRGRKMPLGEQESVKAWGRKQADPRFKSCDSLHLSALQGHRNVLEFYLQKGLIDDADAKSENGWTPLHFAIYRGSRSMIRCLHRGGAAMNSPKGQATSDFMILNADEKRKLCVHQTLEELGARTSLDPEKPRMPGELGLPCNEEGDESDTSFTTHSSFASNWSQKAELPAIHRNDNFMFVYGSHLQAPRSRPVPLGAALQKTIVTGDLTALKDAWMMGARSVSCWYCSPISCAVRFGRSDVLGWLTDNGADISELLIECPSHDRKNRTRNPRYARNLSRKRGIPMKVPWICAADPTFNSVLPNLLSRYFQQQDKLTILDEFPDTPLNTALGAKNYQAAGIIISHVREYLETFRQRSVHHNPVTYLVNHKDPRGKSPLYLAMKNPSTARLLVENGAEVNLPHPKDGHDFLLHSAIDSSCLGTSEHLLASGAHVNSRDQFGCTPLQVAALAGEAEAFHLLLKNGADPHCLSYGGSGALIDCCRSLAKEWSTEKADILLTLLRLGSDPDQPNIYGVTPTQVLLPIPSSRGLFLGRTLSLENAVLIDWKGYYMSEARDVYIFHDPKFHLIVRAYGKDCLARVMNLHPPAGDFGPLCLAAAYDSVAMMENLLSLGADMEFEGCRDGTALMAACVNGKLSAVKFLVRRGARLAYFSCGHVDKTGRGMYRSAFQAARQHPDVLGWLLVHRHTEQTKITDGLDQGDGSTSSGHAQVLGYWSGPVPAGRRFRDHEKRQWWESSLDWLAKVRRIRLDLDGQVVMGAELWPDLDTCEATSISTPTSPLPTPSN